MKPTNFLITLSYIAENLQLGNVTYDAELQIHVYEGSEGITYEQEIVDFINTKVNGIPLSPGYQNFKKFKEGYENIGIDISKQMDETAEAYFEKHLPKDKLITMGNYLLSMQKEPEV